MMRRNLSLSFSICRNLRLTNNLVRRSFSADGNTGGSDGTPVPKPPSFTTEANGAPKFTRSPSIAAAINLILNDQLNFSSYRHPQTGDTLDEFQEGALQAVDIVTEAVSKNQLSTLEEMVTPKCLDSLKETLSTVDPSLLPGYHVKAEDVFMAWVPSMSKDGGDNDSVGLRLVVLSFPKLGVYKRLRDQMKARVKSLEEEVKRLGNPDLLKEGVKDIAQSQISQDSDSIRKSHEIHTSNFVFRLVNGDWLIDDITFKRFSDQPSLLFNLRWSFRVFASINTGKDIKRVTRIDYATDAFILFFFWMAVPFPTLSFN